MIAQYTQHKRQASTFAEADEDLQSTLSPDKEAWEERDAVDASADDTEVSLRQRESDMDKLIAQYFGDVRQFPLLTRDQERTLWAHIERHKSRLRRALCCTPVALTVLLRTWQQVEQGTLPLRQMVCGVDDSEDQEERCTQIGDLVHTLHTLYDAIWTSKDHTKQTGRRRAERRQRRLHRVQQWRQWLATWEALHLQPAVYKAIQNTLQQEVQAQPDHMALGMAHRLVWHAQQSLEQSKAQMMHANLRLVIHVANRYRNRGLAFLDLIQEGNLGLMRALEKFEPARDLKFVTYAHWWIRQAISRAITEQNRTVRLPSHIIERKSKLRVASDKLWEAHGRAPSVQELSVALEWTAQEVEDLLAAVQPISRLHESRTEDGSMLLDILQDTQAVQPEDLVAEDQLQHRVTECLASLTEREAFILRQRYGLGCDQPQTLQEIADVLGLSRERVRQVEKQACEKLRQPRWRALLEDFAEVGYSQGQSGTRHTWLAQQLN